MSVVRTNVRIMEGIGDLAVIVDKLSAAAFDEVPVAELLEVQSALEQVYRRLPAVQHRVMAAVKAQSSPAELASVVGPMCCPSGCVSRTPKPAGGSPRVSCWDRGGRSPANHWSRSIRRRRPRWRAVSSRPNMSASSPGR